MSGESSVDCPPFLYSSTVKKLHKRNNTRYQRRRLEIYPDRVDYFKVDSEKRSGSIPINGVRAELCIHKGTSNHFEFVYDDLKERRFVFKCSSEVALATMLWITNGEQFNNFRTSIKHLRSETLDFLMGMKTQPYIRELVKKKYQQAAAHFQSAWDGSGYTRQERDYEDVFSLGLIQPRCSTDSSSSDDDDISNNSFKMTSRPSLKKAKMPSMEFEMDGGYITHATQAERQKNFLMHKGTPSLEHSDDPNYMSIPQLAAMQHKMRPNNSSEMPNPTKENDNAKIACKRGAQNVPGIVYNITYDCNSNNVIDFGSREVNSIKVRVQGQADYIEVDVDDLGQTLEALKSCLCSVLDIEREDIVCIRKLPDVRIFTDKDVTRIRAGRHIEVELTET